MTTPLDDAHPLLALARRVAADPSAWDRAAAEVRAPAFLERLRREGAWDPVIDALAGARMLAAPPLGFLAAALAFEMHPDPGYELGLNVLDHPADDLRLLPIRIAVGASIAQRVAREASADDRQFFFNLMGNGYAQCPAGSRAENQEKAILCYERALAACRRADAPDDWSMLRNNLGNVYKERLAGSWRANHQAGRTCYEEALASLEEARRGGRLCVAEYEERRGDVENNLGNAHRDRPPELGEPPRRNVEMAVECFRRSLEFRRGSPRKRAESLRNLGTVYMLHAERGADCVEDALKCFAEALDIYRSHPAPLWHALVLMNLGAAYTARRRGARAENLRRARSCLEEAVDRYRALNVRRERISAHLNLGSLKVEADDLRAAYRNFETAAVLVEEEFAQSETEMARGAWLRLHADVYEGVIGAAVMLDGQRAGEPADAAPPGPEGFAEKAAYWAEVSRAKNLAEWMDLRRRRPEVTRLRDLDHRWAAAECAASRDAADRLRRRRHALHAELEAQLAADSTRSRATSTGEFQRLADETGSALVTLRMTAWGACGVVVPPGRPVAARRFDSLRPPEFADLLRRWYRSYESIRGLRGGDLARAHPVDRARVRRKAVAAWRGAIAEVLEALGEPFGRQLHGWLAECCAGAGVEVPASLTILPGQGFNLLPLHALSWSAQGRRVWADDDCPFSYVPSCRILARCLKRRRRAQAGDRLLCVQNPAAGDGAAGRLPWFDVLGREVARRFERPTILGSRAERPDRRATFARLTGFVDPTTRGRKTPGALERHEIVLMAAHGCYEVDDPWGLSGLEIACTEPGGAPSRLTLADLFELDLSQVHLMVLAACETAGTDPSDPTGEQLGLPAAMLAAGAATAVGSLWEVESGPTMLLVRRFFEELLADDSGADRTACAPAAEPRRARALWRAQRWLRACPAEELNRLLREMSPSARPVAARNAEPPYAHPYYWSAFACFGAP